METLIVRILPDNLIQWTLSRNGREFPPDETPIAFSELRSRVPEAATGRRIIILVPGQDVLLTSVRVAPKQRPHLREVLPFLVEEQLAEDVEKLHIVIGSEEQHATTVAVVQKALMVGWLAALHDQGIVPDTVLPETLALPYRKNGWTLLSDGKTIWLRTGLCQGATVEATMILPLIELLLLSAPPAPILLECLVTNEFEELTKLLKTLQIRFPFFSPVVSQIKSSPWRLFCDSAPSTTFNLLKDAFASSSSRSRATRRWLTIAVVAASLFVLQIISDGGQTIYFSVKANQMRLQTIALYQQVFPAEKHIVNPVQQMKSHLNDPTVGSGKGFLYILGQTASGWDKAANNSEIQVQTIDYRDQTQTLTLDVTASKIDTLNHLAERLGDRILNVKLLSVTNNKDGVKAQISIAVSTHD